VLGVGAFSGHMWSRFLFAGYLMADGLHQGKTDRRVHDSNQRQEKRVVWMQNKVHMQMLMS
jgi:hypothetical protein